MKKKFYTITPPSRRVSSKKLIMDNEDVQLENLENLTQEQLDALERENSNEDTYSEPTIDYKAKYETEQKRAATLQRLLNKKGDKTTNNQNNKTNNEELEKDIAEIKFLRKIERFAEDNSLTKAQAEKVLKLYPDATSEILKDPFIAEGLKALARKERVENSTPGAGRPSNSTSKGYSEMTLEERKRWYAGL